MYRINDMVVYGNAGVCKVTDICTPEIPGAASGKLYYILQPVYQSGKIYTPVDTNIFMRSVITPEKAQALIDRIPTLHVECILNEDKQEMLEEHYKALWQTHDCTDLIRLIKELYDKKKHILGLGKKFGQTDERYLERAEDMLYSEFSTVLDMPKDAVKDYIKDNISKSESNGI